MSGSCGASSGSSRPSRCCDRRFETAHTRRCAILVAPQPILHTPPTPSTLNFAIPFLLLHSRYYALAHGVQPWSVRSVLEAGVAAASARYVFGDLARSEDVSALSLHGQRSVSGQRAVEQIEALGSFCGVPAFDLQNTMCPTTIGLGDAFVGGAVAALLQCPRPGV